MSVPQNRFCKYILLYGNQCIPVLLVVTTTITGVCVGKLIIFFLCCDPIIFVSVQAKVGSTCVREVC
jgi:hypothetical protein